jgi:hypothetical protein
MNTNTRSIDAPWGQDEIFYLDLPPCIEFNFEFNGQTQTAFLNGHNVFAERLEYIVQKTKGTLQTGHYKFSNFDDTYPAIYFILIKHGNLCSDWVPRTITFHTLGKPNNPNALMQLDFLVNNVSVSVYGSIYSKKSKDWIYGKKAEMVRACFTGLNCTYEYHYTKSCRTRATMASEPAWLTEELLLDYNHYASLLEEYSVYEKY